VKSFVVGTLIGGILLGIAQQFGAHFNEQYTVLAGNVLFLLVLAIRPQGLFGKEGGHVVSVDDLTPSINPSRSSATRSGRLHPRWRDCLGGLFTWAPWILPASDVSILMNFFILVIMATMWNLLAGYAGMCLDRSAGFIGLGAYATLYFAIKGMDPFVAIPLR